MFQVLSLVLDGARRAALFRNSCAAADLISSSAAAAAGAMAGVGSPAQNRNGAHGRAGSSAYLERQTNKAKTPAANELMQIDEILVMRKTHFPENMMNLLV